MTIRQRLVASSALMLFLELALIRWTGSNILHLSYFTNFVLLGSFLGIGLGFLRTRADRRLPYYSPVVLALLVIFVTFFPVTVDRTSNEVIYFSAVDSSFLVPTGPPIWITLPLIFLATAVALMGTGELVGRCFLQLPRLDAYRWDLIGSLTGIAAFTALSYLHAPPLAWGLVVAAAYVVLLRPRLPWPVSAAALVLVGTLAMETLAPNVSWSAYYKVEAETSSYGNVQGMHIKVNGVDHQFVTTASARLQAEPQYGVPYDRIANNTLDNVLVVGAGTGTDVAIALAKGAKHVDAVEIDKRLLEIGKERNPDRAYQDPRVTTHVNDGRAFLERVDKKFDLILFALPDSLTLVNGASSLRLESYLFTTEAIASAREHLTSDGAFAMYNFYREAWLVERLQRTLTEVFGHPPCVDANPGASQQAVFTVARKPENQRCASQTGNVAATAGPAPVSDDRPFLYLKDRAIPQLYTVALGLILVASLLAVRVVAGPLRTMRPHADLFFLGTAFFLLETKSVATFALLFGTTWVVNAIVFSGVLLAVLAAVEVTQRWRTPRLAVMYALLGTGLLLAWLVPNSWLLGLPIPLRAITAITVAFLPIFAANIVFAKRFVDTVAPTTAFGANLLGAMVGGCLEYAALLVGYHALLIVAALLYAGAFILMPRASRAAVT